MKGVEEYEPGHAGDIRSVLLNREIGFKSNSVAIFQLLMKLKLKNIIQKKELMKMKHLLINLHLPSLNKTTSHVLPLMKNQFLLIQILAMIIPKNHPIQIPVSQRLHEVTEVIYLF